MNRLNKLFERVKNSPDYKRKAARAALTADLRILIANSGKNYKEIAEEIGISPAALSSKLAGNKNLTIDSIVDIASAAGSEFDIVFRPAGRERSRQTWEKAAPKLQAIERAEVLFFEIRENRQVQRPDDQKPHAEGGRLASFRSVVNKLLDEENYQYTEVCANDDKAKQFAYP